MSRTEGSSAPNAAALAISAALIAVGLVWPWAGTQLGAAFWAAAPERTISILWSLGAALSVIAALLAAVCAGAGRACPPRLCLIASAVALLAVGALTALPAGHIWTPFDATRREGWGFSWPLLAASGSVVCAAISLRPGDFRPRLAAAVVCLAATAMGLVPAWPGADFVLPWFAALRGSAGAAVGTALLVALVLSTGALALRRRAVSPRMGWALAAGWLLLPALWQLAHGPPAAAFLLTGLVGLAALGIAPLLHDSQVPSQAPGAPDAPPAAFSRAPFAIEATVLVVVVTLWVLLKTHGLAASNTDENIYFYQAWLWAQGEWPYRDFFFAHPPLHLVPPAAFIAVFGFNLTAIKCIAPLAAAGAGLFVHKLARRAFGPAAAALALIAFLFSAELLKASTNLTGVNLTLLWIAAGSWAAAERRFATAGALFAIAASTGFYAMAGFMAWLAIALFADRKGALRMGLAFAAVFGAVFLLFAAIGGDAYFEGVYRYHALKPVKLEGRQEITGPDGRGLGAFIHNFWTVFLESSRFRGQLYYNGTLWWSALLALFPIALSPWLRRQGERFWTAFDPRRLLSGEPRSIALALWLVALAYFIELSMLRELHDHYFVLPFAALAPLSAFALFETLRIGAVALHRHWSRAPAVREWAVVAVLLICLAFTGPLRAWANAKAWPEEAERRGEVVTFEYTPPPVGEGASGLVEQLFWRHHRIRGQLQPGYAHYLWSKKRWFSRAQPMADYIRQNTPEHATLLGASTVAPLVALLSGRRIAANEVDTNSKRFYAGLLTPEALFERACATPLAYLVAGPQSFFTPQGVPKLPIFKGQFRLAQVFDDSHVKHFGASRFALFLRVGPPDATPPVCRWPTPPVGGTP